MPRSYHEWSRPSGLSPSPPSRTPDVISFSGDAMTVLFCEPGADGLKKAARRCAQCALHILQATSNFSLKDEGLDNKLTLHAGMGAGTIRAIQERRAGASAAHAACARRRQQGHARDVR